jgi:hypothetical protein
MDDNVQYEIDDTDRVPPHVRLCHVILREGLGAGFTAVELTTPPGAMPIARAMSEGSWKPLMAFPPPVYDQLVQRFKHMAGIAPHLDDTEGTILVRLAGRDATITLHARNDQGSEELVLYFPAKPVAS